jgi:hypothetical protein
LSIGLLLSFVQVSSAATILANVNVTVENDNSITVTSNGTSQFFGGVGTAGSYGFINGWGVASGQVTWRDTNNAIAATLSSSGVFVPSSGRIANSNGSKSGSVSITGSTALGAALRQSLGVGVHAYISTAAQGSVAFQFSGTATIPQDTPTVISGLVLEVNTANGNSVTIIDGGTPVAFGSVGSAGDFDFVNGWGASSGTLTWRDTGGSTAATLDASGMHVPVADRVANGAISGVVTLTGSTALGTALASQLGEGTSPFSSLVAESATTEFYLEGTVTVPEPTSALLGWSALLVLTTLRSVRSTRAT